MKRATAWEDWVNLPLGLWIFASPFVLNYSLPSVSFDETVWNFWIVGLIVFASSALSLISLRSWKEWTNLAAGIWLMLSPWMLGYHTERSLLLNSLIVGFLVALFSGLAIPVARRREGELAYR